MSNPDGQSRPRRTLADKLNFLFATVRPPNEAREYTNAEIAEAAGVSPTYIGYLRRGVRDNPTMDTVQALARLFRIRPSYLIDDELDDDQIANVESQLRLKRALDEPGVKKLAMRVADAQLSVEALEALAAMVDQVRLLDRAAATRPRPRRSAT